MSAKLKNRVTEIWKDGGWKEIDFRDLHQGQTFRLWEPTGEYVGDFMAASDPYISDENVWMVEVEEIEHGLQ